MNLLIVDDEYYSAESTRMKIAQNGPAFDEIYCAYSMAQALEYFAGHTVAIMILDIEMPGGSGLELLDHIRQNGLDTICIFLTAYAKFEYVSKAMRLTSIDYLLKPVDEEDLLAAVAKAVDQYRHQASMKLNTLQAGYWKESELYLWELFWLDLSADAVSSQRSDIVRELHLRNLNPAVADLSFLPLLIQCNGMDKVPLKKDLYEFLLKNIVREYFYKKEEIPVVVRIDSQFYFLPLPETGRSREELL
ncbi:MAG: response regulator, partial [Lachnospiraceae bacterium]|nr:response regulator [Lachnospiraceae bacterium]